MEKVGIDARIAPIGYHPDWDRKLSIKRDIDVLFIGALRSKRRRSILENIEEKLSTKGINLIRADYGCYTEQRTTLLNCAKIVLDVSRIPWEMSGMRFLISISCGALVICEHAEDTAPYKAGIPFVQVKVPELPNMICHYLEHEDERQAIVDSAYKFVTEKLTLKDSLLQIFGTCYANTAI